MKSNNEHLLTEWKTTIETQMHFNDLIIKFRTSIIAVFLTLSGAVITVSQIKEFEVSTFRSLLLLPLILWLMAYILDYFYYSKLLIASVNHASKFDENEELKGLGYFGLTKEIKNSVSECKYKIIISIYYFAPLLLGILFIYFAEDILSA